MKPLSSLQPKSLLSDVNAFATSDTLHYVSKGIILFTLFYTSMNYAFYRGLRRDYEKAQEKNDKDNKKHNKKGKHNKQDDDATNV